MEFQRFDVPDLVLVTPEVHGDDRGFFMEAFRQSLFTAELGTPLQFVQENHSRSARGVLRGLHYQLEPQEQGKLVRVVRGRVFDVAVDIRHGSATFGRHVAVELSESNRQIFWVPPGFAHGFCSLEEGSEVLYHVTKEWSREHERGLKFDDPVLGIDWPLPREEIQVNPRDASLPPLAAAESNFSA
jgi:dTDP-4-dehydrorhamnose 3,5-epimerase